MNDNAPSGGQKAAPMVPIIGVIVDDGRVVLTQPLPRRPAPSLQLVRPHAPARDPD